MKTIIISTILSISTLTSIAQVSTPLPRREGPEVGLGSYIWRGQDLGGVSLQPTLGLENKGISLSAWGSVGLADPADTKEFDITLGYTIGGLNIGITDYWFNAGLDPQDRYFKYDAHGTNHVFEANIGYDFGVVSAQWYTNISGNDGVNKDGTRAYSSYFEVTNLAVRASKDIKVTDSFSIPIFGEVSANPCSQKAYLVVGMSLGL